MKGGGGAFSRYGNFTLDRENMPMVEHAGALDFYFNGHCSTVVY